MQRQRLRLSLPFYTANNLDRYRISERKEKKKDFSFQDDKNAINLDEDADDREKVPEDV